MFVVVCQLDKTNFSKYTVGRKNSVTLLIGNFNVNICLLFCSDLSIFNVFNLLYTGCYKTIILNII